MVEKYKVTGMSCAACSARVEKAIRALDGVEACTVNLLTGDVCVVGNVSKFAVIDAVVSAGYGVSDEKEQETEKISLKAVAATRALIFRLCLSLGLVVILMYFSMGHMLGLPDLLGGNYFLNGVIQMAIAAVVMLINHRFFISGVRGIIHGAPNMDTLVSLGSLASFGYSVAMLVPMRIEMTHGGEGSMHIDGL